MWDLVGNPEDRFSHNEAQIIVEIVFLEDKTNKMNYIKRNDQTGPHSSQSDQSSLHLHAQWVVRSQSFFKTTAHTDEPRHEKTCLRDFRPDLTQTGL